MSLEFRQIGRSRLMVAPLAFGGNVFGWTVDEPTSFQLLDEFAGQGFNLIDTADVYSNWKPGNTGGDSETIIGKWLKRSGKRHQVIVATKVGHQMSETKRGLKKAYILQAVEDSLRRLQTDYIDLYQSHKDDPNTPVDETLEAYAQLMAQGKVRAIGASNFSAERLVESLDASQHHGYPRYECLQPGYNLYDRADYETNLEAVCEKNGLGVISYFSLASGFLTGKYRSEADSQGRARAARVKAYLNERGYRILAALDQVSKEASVPPAQISLAWLMARPSITAPIASATSLNQLHDLIAATRVRLSPAQITLLDEASAEITSK